MRKGEGSDIKNEILEGRRERGRKANGPEDERRERGGWCLTGQWKREREEAVK